ncbi:hypothetical protein MSG28_010160 [Choristoneura fumiferana]|uniref:Uncharacterized protein n=1 Tax=Choristoneura fumiferana TaxID=7141 RepID=A0ACC0KJH7_CHOFU|nr:hypothetical protein MSG28_010160 [Choristoneura fumiferana]
MIRRKFITLCKSKYRSFSSLSQPDIDIGYYCDVKNLSEVKQNISLRKGVGNLDRVLDIYSNLKAKDVSDSTREVLEQEFYSELSKLPNKTHPSVREYKDEPRLVHQLNEKKDFGTYTPLEFSEITRLMNLMRTDKLGQTCGHKSYYFLGELAELEEALIKYAITHLIKENFQLISVPDILPKNILESCGMSINSDRTQIYSLDPIHHGSDLYLSGTAEMSLAGLLMNSVHSVKDLPVKLAAVSRCFRAETSNIIEERGVYRRLNITYNENNTTKYVHTLNGTACAIPRLLITLLETHQDPKGKIFIPEILQPFINGKKVITKNIAVPDLKLIKLKK